MTIKLPEVQRLLKDMGEYEPAPFVLVVVGDGGESGVVGEGDVGDRVNAGIKLATKENRSGGIEVGNIMLSSQST